MTIAQQLKIKDFPFFIKNKNGKLVYHETSKGDWIKYEYDSKGNEIYWEDSTGDWMKHEYDSNGNEIFYEDSNGVIVGVIVDKRPKTVEVTLEEIAAKMGINVEQLRIKE